MQSHILVFLLFSVALTEGYLFFFGSQCPIRSYSSSRYITGSTLYIHNDFRRYVEAIEDVAKRCRVHVFVRDSFYKTPTPSSSVSDSSKDLVIGHGFEFELRDENNNNLCNKMCLANDLMKTSETSCFLSGVRDRGVTWSRANSNVLSDNTYALNRYSYDNLKTDVQTKCQNEKFKRQLLRQLRRMQEEMEQENENNFDDEKKK